eukprot:TRINITY_DN17318_c0_g7_i1.p1 TRINITY_DN17318_c0_g7~~TRINITY_DN17318_c0_g7_i1.p1  ORF type:complete len:344 (+),score=50.11 TRINITY_DN17318_c0_g7_i1:182-1213(+)
MMSNKNMGEKTRKCFKREADALLKLRHKNIVRLYDLMTTANHYYLVFEYCNGGDLGHLCLNSKETLNEPAARHIMRQLIAAINEIYLLKYMHRDIKPDNILLHYPDAVSEAAKRPVVKLGDFGFAKLLSGVKRKGKGYGGMSMSAVGTFIYMAPELLHGRSYSFQADIWSIGLVLYEMVCGRHCYFSKHGKDQIKAVDRGIYKVQQSLTLSAECLDFINGCLQLDDSARMSLQDILRHGFVGSEEYTKFDIEEFREMNKGEVSVIKDCFAFSSKVRYHFLPPKISSPNNLMIPLIEESKERKEDRELYEYLEVLDCSLCELGTSEEFTVACLAKFEVHENYFR